VRTGKFDVFLWELFMSKPWEDSGEVRLAGTVSAPWPSFMVAARAAFSRTHAAALQRMLAVIARASAHFTAAADSPARISSSFGLAASDAAKWLQLTHYATDARVVSRAALHETAAALVRARVLKAEPASVDSLVDVGVATLE
jgi:hypothetical protein